MDSSDSILLALDNALLDFVLGFISPDRNQEAERAARVGIAQAMAIEEQVKAYGGPQFQLVQQVMGRFAEAIEKSQVDVVPKIHLGGGTGGAGGSGNLIENLLGVLLSEKVGETIGLKVPGELNPRAEALKAEMRGKLLGGNGTTAA